MENSLSIAELESRLYSTSSFEELSAAAGQPYLLVESSSCKPISQGHSVPQPNCPVIALAKDEDEVSPIIDVVAHNESDLDTLIAAITNNPMASTVLVQLLRHNERADVADSLYAESLAYSCLQHGAEFLSWLENRKQKPKGAEEHSLVLLDRQENDLTITLNRPYKRNAYSAGLRDALCEALGLVIADDSIQRVVVNGAGACFSAGGDLDEFGEAKDAALAHVVRMTRSAGSLVHRLRDRIEFHVHGACIGAGIELPAFAHRIVAAPGTFFQLPEVAMGLIPGAGGTVSILPRIGRHRTAFMALSNSRIDVETALAWGLVDEIS